MNTNNLFSELKRRNVYKVAVACAVIAWLTIRAAPIFLSTFDAPQIVVLVLTVAVAIALMFFWALKIAKRFDAGTPE